LNEYSGLSSLASDRKTQIGLPRSRTGPVFATSAKATASAGWSIEKLLVSQLWLVQDEPTDRAPGASSRAEERWSIAAGGHLRSAPLRYAGWKASARGAVALFERPCPAASSRAWNGGPGLRPIDGGRIFERRARRRDNGRGKPAGAMVHAEPGPTSGNQSHAEHRSLETGRAPLALTFSDCAITSAPAISSARAGGGRFPGRALGTPARAA